MDYSYTLKLRGQPVQFQGKRGSITIRTSQLQRGTRPTVGLSDALLDYINKRNITLYVNVLAPEVSFKTTAKEWKKGATKDKVLKLYPDNTGDPYWYIFRKPIPEEAFEKQEEKKVLVEMTEDERERYQYYKIMQRR